MPNVLRTIGWGLFASASWTWCIGMWLPLLLIDRWGWPGFWMFALPNVLGCTAMGYLLRDRAHSVRLVAANRGAMRWFSSVTVAYHLLFLAMLWGTSPPWPGRSVLGALLVPIVAWAAALVLSQLPQRGWPWLGGAFFAAMLAAWVVMGSHRLGEIPDHGTRSVADLAFTAPIVAMGFLLCPWLDATFHRTRQSAPGPHAFGVLGVAFLATLLFVVACVRDVPPESFALVMCFFLGQSIFTMAAHLREIRLLPGAGDGGSTTLLSALPLLAVLGGWLIWRWAQGGAEGLLEDAYLRVLAVYAVVVPAWVLWFAGPFGSTPKTRRTLLGWTALVLVLAAAAEIGFLHEPAWALLVPPVVLLMIVGGRAVRTGGPSTR